MTAFVKEHFEWDGMYLMYHGPHDGAETAGEVAARTGRPVHPTRENMIYPAFIARFKYNRKPYKRWINWLVANATVEEYLALAEFPGSPVDAMKSLGCTASWL
jgi:hypothetical protein